MCFYSHGNELVADTSDRHEPLGPRGIGLDLAADVRDVEVGRALVADELAVPEVLHDRAPRVHAPRLSREECEQLQLRWRQLHGLAVDGRLVSIEIDPKPADHARRRRRVRVELPPPEKRTNPR